MGIATLLTPFRAPTANTIAERVVRTRRTACLDHPLIRNERRLRVVLAAEAAYSNADRPRRSLAPAPPLPAERDPPARGAVTSRSILGGLHHVYQRAA
jgi:hypothetical protein